MMTPDHQWWMGQRKKGVGAKGRERSKCQNVRVWLGVTVVHRTRQKMASPNRRKAKKRNDVMG